MHSRKNYIFTQTSSALRHVSVYLDHLLRVNNINKEYKDMAGLFNTLKFVHKIFADIIKFVRSRAELVCKMRTF